MGVPSVNHVQEAADKKRIEEGCNGKGKKWGANSGLARGDSVNPAFIPLEPVMLAGR